MALVGHPLHPHTFTSLTLITDDSGFRPENVSKHDGGTNGFGNGSDGGADAGGGGDDDGCRICHSTEHYARECPDKPEGQGQCFNCGQEGESFHSSTSLHHIADHPHRSHQG